MKTKLRSFLLLLSLGFVTAISVWADPITQVTTTGAVFTKVEHAGFGESWKDPSGEIWGDEMMDASGNPLRLTWQQAIGYCTGIGADFPSKDDFVRLREYMGASPGTNTGYVAQILPHLNQGFWSQSYGSDLAYALDGSNGAIIDFDISYNYSQNFRCVAH